MQSKRYFTRLEQIPQLSEKEVELLKPVTDRFVFRVSKYYLSLIDWTDPDDPIRRIVMPDSFEIDEKGELDASGEEDYTEAPGLQHKYSDTALLLVNDVCGAYCRFCFRKRLFMDQNDEVVREVSNGINYISQNTTINNVLLTGGDPLLMSTRRIVEILSKLTTIPHVKIVRFGSKMLAFNPFRVLDDPGLLKEFANYNNDRHRIYLMNHFNHPRELTAESYKAIRLLQEAGVTIVNQTPLIRGVNDKPEVLRELFNSLSFIGVAPYYLFQCRPTEGNATYAVPIEEGLEIFNEAKHGCSGVAARVRFSASHNLGKIEIIGVTEKHAIFKFHRTPYQELENRVMVFKRNPNAYWLDDYEEFAEIVHEAKHHYGKVVGGN